MLILSASPPRHAAYKIFSEEAARAAYLFCVLRNLARIKWLIVGAAFVVLGIVGLFLPILQGILFIVIGLMCLAKGSAWVRSKKMSLKKRFPKFGSKLTLLEQKARDWKARWRKRREKS